MISSVSTALASPTFQRLGRCAIGEDYDQMSFESYQRCTVVSAAQTLVYATCLGLCDCRGALL